MGPSAKPKFSSLFASPWLGDASDYSDFADNQQSNISTDEESVLLGDDQVVAEGCAADSDDDNSASGQDDSNNNTSNDEPAIEEDRDSSGEERLEISLTDEQISILSRQLAEFRAANKEG
ncbi:hypothetical protein V8E53_002610 [Lactarius tabidus]